MADGPLWHGCHGVRLRPPELAKGYGSARGVPILEASLGGGTVGPPGPHELWRLTGKISLPQGPQTYDQRLTRHADGSLSLHTERSALHIDPAARTLTIDADAEGMRYQLVTTYGLPLLLQHEPALILHACAAIPPGGDVAHVISGRSGAGKSTILVGLIETGWRAVSEDVCVIDLRGPSPVVWPGPPWVRPSSGGPTGSRIRFRTIEKTAWDIAPWQVDHAARVGRIVFIDPAGGETAVSQPLSSAEALARVARSTAWLTEQSTRAESTFALSSRLVREVQAAKLRLPVEGRWLDRAISVLHDD